MRGAPGYILLESIVSMALLSICMLSIYGVMRDATLMRGLAEDYTTARFLLEEVVAEHELQPQVATGRGEGRFPAPHDRFSYAWVISRVEVPMVALPPSLTEEQRLQLEQQFQKYLGRVSVTIRWSRGGEDYEATGETLLAPGQLWTPPELL